MTRPGFPAAVVLGFAAAGALLLVALLLGGVFWIALIPAAGLVIYAGGRARALGWSLLATLLVGAGSVAGAMIVIGFALSVR